MSQFHDIYFHNNHEVNQNKNNLIIYICELKSLVNQALLLSTLSLVDYKLTGTPLLRNQVQ